MKKYVDGKYIEMTAEEIEAIKADMPAEKETPTLEARLTAVEQGFENLKNLFSKLF